ncbi:MAG: hypothetical protein OEZ39_12375 [Gammaproteobacteria bacterium]|nr:hypothetical protein [Gammaproteobacteria bacterium]MDH5652641.1 hypothetical protein [Gammaproteobacteria bacterium]
MIFPHRIIIPALLLFFLSACDNRNDNDAAKVNIDYQGIYSALWLVHNGKDYPASRQVLNLCQQYNNESCLDMVRRVKSAVYLLKRLEPNETLNQILQTMRTHCSVSNARESERLCVGANNALFYFNSAEQDQKIFQTIAQFDQYARESVFTTDRNWFHNRPDIKPWLKLINESGFTPDMKTTIREFFEDRENREFGLLLVN